MTIKRHFYNFQDGKTELSAGTFNQIFSDLDARLHVMEQLGVSWKDAVSELQQYGLERINGALAPVLEQMTSDIDELNTQQTSFSAWWESVREDVADIHTAAAAMQLAVAEITATVDGFEAALAAGLATKADGESTAAALAARATIADLDIAGTPYNGDFQIAQEATAHSTVGYGSIDGQYNDHVGSGVQIERMPFAMGQTDVPGEPRYYMRCTVTSVPGSGNYALVEHRIPGVQHHAGCEMLMALDARADGQRRIALGMRQCFGTGGTPSATVDIPAQTVMLSSVWSGDWIQRRFSLPSVAGKSLGTNGDDYLAMRIMFDMGSQYDSISDMLGQQSGVFDIAKWRLVGNRWQLNHMRRDYAKSLWECKHHLQVHNLGSTPEERFNQFFISAEAGASWAGVQFMLAPTMIRDPVASYTGYTAENCTLGTIQSSKSFVNIRTVVTQDGRYLFAGGKVKLDARV